MENLKGVEGSEFRTSPSKRIYTPEEIRINRLKKQQRGILRRKMRGTFLSIASEMLGNHDLTHHALGIHTSRTRGEDLEIENTQLNSVQLARQVIDYPSNRIQVDPDGNTRESFGTTCETSLVVKNPDGTELTLLKLSQDFHKFPQDQGFEIHREHTAIEGITDNSVESDLERAVTILQALREKANRK